MTRLFAFFLRIVRLKPAYVETDPLRHHDRLLWDVPRHYTREEADQFIAELKRLHAVQSRVT